MYTTTFYCSECKQTLTVVHDGPAHGTGYAVKPNGHKVCYSCCGYDDRVWMTREGQACMYLTDKGVTNWCGSLVFPVLERREGSHNIARTRTDVWFRGPDGYLWHGVQLGDMSEICRCKRTVQR